MHVNYGLLMRILQCLWPLHQPALSTDNEQTQSPSLDDLDKSHLSNTVDLFYQFLSSRHHNSAICKQNTFPIIIY